MGNIFSEADNNEEIIIMTDVKNIAKHFVNDSFILWHDPKIDSYENLMLLEELKTISDVKTFSNWQEAAQYLKDTKMPCCQVITSGTDGEFLVKEISQLKNDHSIYIFCGNVDYHKGWARQYPKVISVDNNFDQLKVNLEKKQRGESSLRIDFPSYAPIFDDVHKSENTYLHFYLKGFVGFKNRNQAKKDLLDLAKALYGKNKYIEDFQNKYNKYNMEAILNWYTKECFLYKITNNCLRIATPDSIQCCRLVLRDLEQAIKEKYQKESKNFSGLLYRAACISDQEWTNLTLNIGKEIEMYGFLSTSKNKAVAFRFLTNTKEIDKKAMITIIVPDAPKKEDQGFAEIKEYSDFNEEDEILFNVMSRFTILEAKIEEFNKGKKYRHLVLLYGAQAMRKFTSESPSIQITTKDLRKCYVCGVEISSLSSSLVLVNPIRCDEYSCLNCFDKYKTENRYAFICVPLTLMTKSQNLEIKGFVMKSKATLDIPFYRSQCRKCDKQNLKYYSKCINCEEKKEYCEKCFYQNECIQHGHVIILETHPFSFWSEEMSEKELHYLNHYQKELENQKSIEFQQALIFEKTHNHKRVIEYINKLLEKHGQKNDSITASSYDFLGRAYFGTGEYEKAIQFHSKALEITKTVLGDQHPDTAASYNNLGLAYYEMGEYQKAIQFHSKALEIRKTVLVEQHSNTAASYNNLGLAYYKMGEHQKAIQFHSKALEIIKTVLGDQHPDTAASYNNLGLACDEMGEYQKAIQFYSKALEIRKTVLGDQHTHTAASYNNLGSASYKMGEYQEAIKYYSKALEIKKTVLGDQHPNTADSYNNLGGAYEKTGEYQKAIEFHSKALEIKEKVLGNKHPKTLIAADDLNKSLKLSGKVEDSS